MNTHELRERMKLLAPEYLALRQRDLHDLLHELDAGPNRITGHDPWRLTFEIISLELQCHSVSAMTALYGDSGGPSACDDKLKREIVRWASGRKPLTPLAPREPDSRAEPAAAVPASDRGRQPTLAEPKASQAAVRAERQRTRLVLCEAKGIVFDRRSLLRLPDGIGKVAEDMGITRQSLSTDVKAALRRRFEEARNGRA